MNRWLKWLLIPAVVVLVVGAVAYPVSSWWQERSKVKYLTATISRGPVETVVNSTGTIKAVRTVSVGAFTSGPIKEMRVDFNSEISQVSENEWLVKTKDKEEKVKWLALIDDKLQTAAVERDKAAVASAQAELGRVGKLLEHAIRKEKRGDDLLNVKPKPKFPYISAAELDVLKYEVLTLRAQEKVAQAAVNQAQANLKNAEDQLRYTKILPPQEIDAAKGIKGRVIDRKVDAGQTVVGAFNAVEMFTIALEMDIHVHVYAAVDEADIGEIRLASERKEGVTFTVDAHPDVLFPGKVHDIRLNSTTTQNVVTYPVIIDAPNEKQLLTPGTTANITFQLRAAKDVLRVPVAALRFTPPKEQVRPEDRYRLEALSSSRTETGAKRTADEKAKTAAAKSERHVWVQDGKLLRAVPVTLGLTEHQYAELRKGDLREGDVVVTGIEANVTPR